MARKSLTFIAVLAASITLSNIHITGQRNGAQQNVARPPNSSQPPSPSRGNANAAAQTQGQNKTAQGDAEQGITSPVPPVQISVSPSFVTSGEPNQQQRNNQSTAADWWLVGLTFLIFSATVALAVIASRQLRTQSRLTRRALRLTREANEAAAKDREEAAKINRSMLDNAKLSLYLAQRARVVIKEAEIQDLGPNRPLIGLLIVRNWDGKAARPDRFCIVMKLGSLPDEPPYPSDADWGRQDVLLVAGDHPKTFRQAIDRQISAAEWADIQNVTLTLHVYGRVDYQTMGAKLHSGYCARYLPGTGHFERIYAPKYNEET